MSTRPDPFAASPGYPAGTRSCTVDDRLDIVRQADIDTLRDILALDDLQITVRRTAAQRLRLLDRNATPR